MKKTISILFVLITVGLFINQSTNAFPAAPGDWVLILTPTITPSIDPGGCKEAAAVLLSHPTYQIEYIPAFTSTVAADYSSYRAIIFGDQTCGFISNISSAEVPAVRLAWSNAVNSANSNVVIIGTDPVFHYSQGGNTMIEKTMCHVLSGGSGHTGAYICLSCYYHNTTVPTVCDILTDLSPLPFTMIGNLSCFNIAHVTGTSPGCGILTDAIISNWSCSVHEAFTTWDNLNFQVLAMAVTGSSYIAPDGTVGMPYVIARGVSVISNITLTPEIDTNVVCDNHTLTATVVPASPPVLVTFTCVAGPSSGGGGILGTSTTNASGVATLTYSNCTPGKDYIIATYHDSGRTLTSNTAVKVWIEENDTSCISIVSDTTYCDSSGTYIYEFKVHNNSPTRTVEQLEITVDSPKPPNYVVTVPSTLNVTIGPSGTSAVQRVRMIGPGAVARTEVCYTLSAQYMHDDCPWCCYIENCIKLPDCGSCVQILSDSLYCNDNQYFYNFTLQNGTIYDVTKIQLTSPGPVPITFVPQIIHFSTPIAPGQLFPTETVQLLGGAAGMTIPIRIKLFSDDFECCYIELPYTLPKCDSPMVAILNSELSINSFNLGQNYPNPFNPTTNISFSVPEESVVEINIYDVSGRLILNLVNNVKYAQGIHSVKFDGANLPSGMYYYRLKTNDYISTRKMVLMK